MDELTDEQRAALTKARGGAELMIAGRRARDAGLRDAIALGLSERRISELLGRVPNGTPEGAPLVSHAAVHRARKGDQ